MIAHQTLAGGMAAFAAWSLGLVTPVLAQDFDLFGLGGGNAKPAVSQVDRDFIKEWERNPPKGFPTLSALNLVPMKAAIRRYEEIVKSGGWQSIPDVK
jgi:L,D-transpeptidase YcbB